MIGRFLLSLMFGVALLALGSVQVAPAQEPYRPDPALLEAAKREGQILLYTTHIVDQIVRPLIKAFQAYVPGIDVKFVRSDGLQLVVRLLTEARAGRVQSDVWSMVEGVGPVLKGGYAAEFEVANAKGLPPTLADPKKRWIATNLSIRSMAYNTQLVPSDVAPHSYADLLAP